jgi:lysophospholipase L1-like esterase
MELGLRWFTDHPAGAEGELDGMYVNDGENSYRLRPGYRGGFTIEGRKLPVTLNSLGMRSPEPEPRRPGQLRVLCLGDSFVFGYGVRDEEAFPTVLGGELAGDPQREVVTGNAGAPGHGTVDMVHQFRHYRDSFDADLVVASIYLGNDFEDDFILSKIIVRGHFMAGPSMPNYWARTLQSTWRGRLAMRSRLALRVEGFLMANVPGLALQPMPTAEEIQAFAGFPPPDQRHAGLFMDAVDEDRFADEATGLAAIPRILARVEESLGRIQELAGKIPVVVLILPTSYHVDETVWSAELDRLGLDPSAFQIGLAQERLVAICSRLGLPHVDFTELARELDDPQSIFLPENLHLNPHGHRLVARRLTEAIEGLLPR